MSTAMERYEQPLALIQSIDDLARLSKQVADSQYYQGTENAAQASVKLMIARELGLGLTSISNIHLVKGKISLGYQILIALVKRSGKYDMRFLERTEERVVIEWFEDGKVVGKSKFDMDDAKRAGLSGDNYRKFPIRMLTARAVSDGFNTFAPECAGGALYTEGEIPEDPEPAPRSRREQSAPVAPSETVIEAEIVEAAAPVVGATAEPNSSDLAEGEPVAASAVTPVDRVKAMLTDLDESPREAIKQALKRLDLVEGNLTVGKIAAQLVLMFGPSASNLDHVLVGLNRRVLDLGTTDLPPVGHAEGEVTASAEAFDAFLEDDTAKNIAAAEKAQDEAAARIKNRDRMAAAGSYGES